MVRGRLFHSFKFWHPFPFARDPRRCFVDEPDRDPVGEIPRDLAGVGMDALDGYEATSGAIGNYSRGDHDAEECEEDSNYGE